MRLPIGILLLISVAFYRPAQAAGGADGAATRLNDSASTNRFALGLLQRSDASGGNNCLAPIGVRSLLSLLLAGARGKTGAEIRIALGDPPRDMHDALCDFLRTNGPTQCIVKNAVFASAQFPVRREFARLAREQFVTSVFQIGDIDADAARKIANDWISAETKGKIPAGFSPAQFNRTTTPAVASIVYFKAPWLSPPSAADTQDLEFIIEHAQKIRVPTMRFRGVFRYCSNAAWESLAIPYDYDHASSKPPAQFEMIVMVPQGDNSISSAVTDLSSEDFAMLTGNLHTENSATTRQSSEKSRLRAATVYLPLFSFSAYTDLIPIAKRLGILDLFTSRADLSGIGDGRFPISNFFQRVLVSVDERGTEAAAAAGISVFGMENDHERVEFRASKPFLFVVKDRESGEIVFMGVVKDPRSHGDMMGAQTQSGGIQQQRRK